MKQTNLTPLLKELANKTTSKIPVAKQNATNTTSELQTPNSRTNTNQQHTQQAENIITNNPIQQIPYVAPTPQIIDNLRNVALGDINHYRLSNGTGSLKMDNAIASEQYAAVLLGERCLHHISDNGATPSMRFQQSGDKLYAVSENLAGGMIDKPLEEMIRDFDYNMMYKDAGKYHNQTGTGTHTDNMLDPDSRFVSIGIWYDKNNIVMVQDFVHLMQQPFTINGTNSTSGYYTVGEKLVKIKTPTAYFDYSANFRAQPSDKDLGFCW